MICTKLKHQSRVKILRFATRGLRGDNFRSWKSWQKGVCANRAKAILAQNMTPRERAGQFYHKNRSIGLAETNPFKKYVSQITTVRTGNHISPNNILVPCRSFGISLTYKFGKLVQPGKTADGYLQLSQLADVRFGSHLVLSIMHLTRSLRQRGSCGWPATDITSAMYWLAKELVSYP